ncbi:MAG: alpha/beta hydrolase [Candidatus Dormibacteraeota bacterium]|nr:alpha/beta hydrolase [Candidatus Dormibacteraeota bacterium]
MATPSPSTPAEQDISHQFQLSSGRVAAELSGAVTAPLVIGIPGLSANLHSFDAIFAGLDHSRHRCLAFDPRGRGHSEVTPPGTYGWVAHARDVLEMADALGASTFDLVGWSMGTWVALQVCALAPGRVRRLVLIDGGGLPDQTSVAPVYAGLERLDTVYPAREEFMRLARSTGIYEPWENWQRMFEYELMDVDGGVTPRTHAPASWEDETYRRGQDPYALWPAVTMPALVVRARQPVVPGLGYILNEADTERFLAEVHGSRAVEVDAQHYTVGLHSDTTRAVAAFLE